MKRNYFYLLLGVLFTGVICVLVIKQPDAAPVQSITSKKILTNQELIAQQKQQKIERRKAGFAKPDKPDKYLEYIHRLKTGGMNFEIILLIMP